MRVTLKRSTTKDADAIANLRVAVADDLTSRYGKGHWSSAGSVKGVLHEMKTSAVFIARNRNKVVATLRLATKKPWAIDTAHFTPANRALYLTTMAVDPGMQGVGIGKACVEEAKRIARGWPADAIRLDAYDAEAGAGGFYRKCGFHEVGRVSYRKVPLIYFELMLELPK